MNVWFVTEYFGVDWLAMLLTFAGVYCLGNRWREGFATMMCGNACWILVGVLASSAAMIVANLILLAMNARGWMRWSREES
jgi:hypothetical protein